MPDLIVVQRVAGSASVVTGALGAGEQFGIGFGVIAGLTSLGMFALGLTANKRALQSKQRRRDFRQRQIGRRQTLVELSMRGVTIPPNFDLGTDDIEDGEEDDAF